MVVINDVKQFMRDQQIRVEQRQEEIKKIKKGIYQTQVMIDSQNMETFMKECEKNDKKTADTNPESSEKTDSKEQEQKMVDIKTEIERMMFGVRQVF